MPLLTATEVRDHVQTDIIDDALDRIINSADAEIVRRLGEVDTETETLSGGSRFLYLNRRAESVDTVTERYLGVTGIIETTLSANDYRLYSDGYRLERLHTGTNPSSVWLGEVTVEYSPIDTTAERKVLLIALVKLELNYTGHLALSVGDVRVQSLGAFADEKAALFRPMQSGGRRLIA